MVSNSFVDPAVSIVLPPREVFSPVGSGAIALLVHRLARASERFSTMVFGYSCDISYDDVAFHPIKRRAFEFSRSKAYRKLILSNIRNSPLIEVHNQPDLATSLARDRQDQSVILFIHNDPRRMRGLENWHRLGSTFPSFGGTICVSAYLARRLEDAVGVKAALMLPNCIEITQFSPLPDPLTRDPVILFAGRVVQDKGADLFARACAIALPRIPGWRSIMIGGDRFTRSSPETPFIQQILPICTEARVTMVGYQPLQHVIDAMCRASIVVVPSRWQEPFGLTALEAMASGAALIVTDRGGLPEVVRDVALSVEADDPIALADAIVHLAMDPTERELRSRAGRLRALHFDVSLASAQLDIFRSFLLNRRGQQFKTI